VFARIGDEELVLAVGADNARKAVRQHSALEVGGEVLLDEAGQPALLCALQQKGREVLPHHLVQHRRLGVPPTVA
jgi:hypothetical protein